MNIITLLGRQPGLSLAELEQRFGSANVEPFGRLAALVSTENFDIQTLGGTVKAGRVIAELEKADWLRLSRDIVGRYARELRGDGKVTLGISVYGGDIAPRDVQRTGIALKQALKKQGRSMRLIPNDDSALSTATSHHNKLGLSANKIELLVFYGPSSVIIAESTGTQNITALAARDQGRPKRDAFVGMLPPKLALMMINLSGITSQSRLLAADDDYPGGEQPERHDSRRETKESTAESNTDDAKSRLTILDPFCGTGVVLQEAALLGFNVYGTDLSEKMVDYTTQNLEWLAAKHAIGEVHVEPGDAIEHTWKLPINAVVAETYLGQPFSAPPAPDKLDKVRRIVDHITATFLENLATQLPSGTPLCLAVPAWRDSRGSFTHLATIKKIESLGYEWQDLQTTNTTKLIYYREDQVVARQLLLLAKK